MNFRQLLDASALEQAALIRAGDVSSVELAELYLARIAEHDSLLHAYIDVRPEQTLHEARLADRRFPTRAVPPFWGVPIAIKDLNLAAGFFMRMGSRSFSNLFAPRDDRTVARLRAAGFVVLGKTTVPEFGSIPVTEPALHPPTRNPWDLEVTPGGSSGGAAAAVAARLAPIAQGSDGGGSIRIPSALCGLVGIKPSRGRVANMHGFADENILYTDGPIARDLDDACALLDVMAGVTVGTPHWAPPPEASFLALSRREPRPLRVGVCLRSPLATTRADVAASVMRVARVLESRGHHLEERSFPEIDPQDFLLLWRDGMAKLRPPDWNRVEAINSFLLRDGGPIGPRELEHARSRLRAQVEATFRGLDILVTPVVPEGPLPVGAWSHFTPQKMLEEATRVAAFVAGFNVSGQPAVSLPIGRSDRGHPIGVQLVGAEFGEATLLAVAHQVLDALPIDRRWPAGFDPRLAAAAELSDRA